MFSTLTAMGQQCGIVGENVPLKYVTVQHNLQASLLKASLFNLKMTILRESNDQLASV